MTSMFGNTVGIKAMSGQGERNSLPLNEICPRAVNKYINDYNEALSMKQTIEKDGLIEPITVNEISEFLKNKDVDKLPKEEKEYYLQKQKEGFKYFITTGHRRFRAFCSLAVGYDVHDNNDMNKFYKDFKKILEDSNKALESGDYSKMNKYCSIKAFIAKDSVEQEKERYNRSNLDQRRIQDFEIVDNILDEMRTNGELEKLRDSIKETKINGMSERAVKDNLNNLLPDYSYKTLEEGKEELKKLDASSFAGYQGSLNNGISEYIFNTKHKKISSSGIKFARGILETFEPRFVELIYNGKLGYKNAITLLSYYNKIRDKDKLYEDISNNNYDFLKEKQKYANKKMTKKNISNSELLFYIKQIKNGKLTIDEVYQKLVNLGIYEN